MTNVFRLKVVLALLTVALVGSSAVRANAQGLTAQIGGSVVDSSNAAVPGATVVVRNTSTAVTRETITDGQGLFVITNIFAGTYDVRVSLAGFAPHEQRGVILTVAERLSLAPIVLQIEGVGEQVLVETAALRASTQSGERSNVIRADEIQDFGLRGRDFLGLLQAMPGVVDSGTSGAGARDAPGWNAFLGTNINGLSDQLMGMSYDGVGSKDTGFGAANYVTPSLDSIAEVKIQTSNYQAEYGRAGGANIVVVTKSGSSRFSGSGSYYKRHEALNANTWARRRTCDAAKLANPNAPPHAECSTARYRYDNTSFTLGGPVLIPGSDFNQDRDKLFFFYTLELMPRSDPFSTNSTFPSALERNGDFSQTFNNAATPVLRHIRDPQLAPLACNVNTGGPGCFPGNVIPQDRIHPVGRQMLNFFPLPQPLWSTPEGRAVSGGQYNYQFSGDTEKLRRENVVRIDWNVRPGTTFYTRFQHGKEVFGRGYYNQASPALIAGNGLGFELTRGSYDINTMGIVATLIHTFTPTTVFEVIVGSNFAEQDVYWLTEADRAAIDYTLVMPGHRQVFADNNPNRIIPNMSFAGSNALPNTASVGIGQGQAFPWLATNPSHNYSANLTHLRGSHNMKFGFFLERTSRPGALSSNAGSYSFNSAAANPLDTNFGWANALLGHLNSYSEGNNNQRSIPQFIQPELFVQDNWRVNRRFTLDLGIRFSHIGVVREKDRAIGWFDPAAYNPANAVQLWQPHCTGTFPCSGAARVARNPITGEIRTNPSWIGQIVEGSGDRNNGTVFGTELPDTYPSAGLRPAPRVGFGWDVTGDGRTAVRGGFGRSFNRLGDGQYGGFTGVTNPPGVSMQWLTIDDRLNAPSLVGVLGGTIVQAETRPITVDSWSIGVQRELPWRLLADVAYVGNRTTNAFAVNSGQSWTKQHNSLLPTQLLDPLPAEWIDPTTGNIYADDFIRPNYPGRGGISERMWQDNFYQKYNAIQFEIRRRLSNGLAWSANYTGSVLERFRDWDQHRTEADNVSRYTHSAGGRPHLAKFTYNWLIPGASRFLGNNPIAAGVLDGWQLSGLSQIVGGTWGGFSFSWSGAPAAAVLTGGLGGSRVIVVCDPNIPRSERTFQRQFNTDCVRPPGPLTDPSDTAYQGTGRGKGTEDARMGLGYHQHDMTLMKNFSLGNRRNLQVRIEMYNVFNHTAWVNTNNGATFDFATGAQTNANFGSVTNTGVRNGSNRVGQVGVRLTF